MENLLKQIKELKERVLATWRLLDLDEKKLQITNYKLQINETGFWNDREKAVEISQKVDELEKEVGEWEELSMEINDLEDYAAMAQKENDLSVEEDINKKLEQLQAKFIAMEFTVLFSGKYDENNAILSVHAGTGGEDAQDWAEILERMFLRFAEKRKWKTEIIDRTLGNGAGIKSVTINITGRNAYGYLKSESGVHRLVRISPFDAEAMRHTSFALVEVIPEMPESVEIEINESDLKIDTYKSSGAGGQHVNTTDSAIRIKHEPSGIIVTCQSQRSQHQNKEKAMKILKSKLFTLQEANRLKEENVLKGEAQKAEWGKQIRSYVMQPYKLVKDHRTEYETANTEAVLNGDLDGFMEAYLKSLKNKS